VRTKERPDYLRLRQTAYTALRGPVADGH